MGNVCFISLYLFFAYLCAVSVFHVIYSLICCYYYCCQEMRIANNKCFYFIFVIPADDGTCYIINKHNNDDKDSVRFLCARVSYIYFTAMTKRKEKNKKKKKKCCVDRKIMRGIFLLYTLSHNIYKRSGIRINCLHKRCRKIICKRTLKWHRILMRVAFLMCHNKPPAPAIIKSNDYNQFFFLNWIDIPNQINAELN